MSRCMNKGCQGVGGSFVPCSNPKSTKSIHSKCPGPLKFKKFDWAERSGQCRNTKAKKIIMNHHPIFAISVVSIPCVLSRTSPLVGILVNKRFSTKNCLGVLNGEVFKIGLKYSNMIGY